MGSDESGGEEDESEGRIDERRDRRADIAKAGPAGEEIDVDMIFAGIVRDRETRHENAEANDQDRGEGVAEPVAQGDRATDSLEREE